MTGKTRPGSRLERIIQGKLPLSVLDERETEDADDDVYDAAMTKMRQYLAAHPEIKHDMRPRKVRAERGE